MLALEAGTMDIIGLEGLSEDQIQFELSRGARFVVFQYFISIIILTFKRSSDIYFVKADEGTLGKGITHTVISLLLGWWGIPWGPIYTIQSLITNLRGGRDVTQAILQALQKETESSKGPVCPHCGASYNPADYRQDAPEWLCSQCRKPLPKGVT